MKFHDTSVYLVTLLLTLHTTALAYPGHEPGHEDDEPQPPPGPHHQDEPQSTEDLASTLTNQLRGLSMSGMPGIKIVPVPVAIPVPYNAGNFDKPRKHERAQKRSSPTFDDEDEEAPVNLPGPPRYITAPRSYRSVKKNRNFYRNNMNRMSDMHNNAGSNEYEQDADYSPMQNTGYGNQMGGYGNNMMMNNMMNQKMRRFRQQQQMMQQYKRSAAYQDDDSDDMNGMPNMNGMQNMNSGGYSQQFMDMNDMYESPHNYMPMSSGRRSMRMRMNQMNGMGMNGWGSNEQVQVIHDRTPIIDRSLMESFMSSNKFQHLLGNDADSDLYTGASSASSSSSSGGSRSSSSSSSSESNSSLPPPPTSSGFRFRSMLPWMSGSFSFGSMFGRGSSGAASTASKTAVPPQSRGHSGHNHDHGHHHHQHDDESCDGSDASDTKHHVKFMSPDGKKPRRHELQQLEHLSNENVIQDMHDSNQELHTSESDFGRNVVYSQQDPPKPVVAVASEAPPGESQVAVVVKDDKKPATAPSAM